MARRGREEQPEREQEREQGRERARRAHVASGSNPASSDIPDLTGGGPVRAAKARSGRPGTGGDPGSHRDSVRHGGPGSRGNILTAAVRRYWLVAATLLVGIAGGILWLLGLQSGVQAVFSIFPLAVAALMVWQILGELRHGRFGVDLLAVIAIAATVSVGEYLAAMIIVLMVTGGEALEEFAESRAERELRSLLEREPQTAHRVDEGTGRLVDVAAGEVRPGETIVVKSGEVVPVDGTLRSRAGDFDESSLTGESLPAAKQAGDEVLSGSINGPAAVTIVATATAADSQFQGIIALVRHAQENRAPVVRLADRYAIPFTAVSLALAAAAWLAAGDARRFAEVLVLATPCPLILAAPIAFVGGMSRAGRAGVVVKGGSVLEALARVRTAVFDKTGTLTHGAPAIRRVVPAAGFDEAGLLTLVASAEQVSSHVLAAAIVAEARRRGLRLQEAHEAQEKAAQGISARVDGRTVRLGTLAFARRYVPDIEAAVTSGGELVIYVVVDGRHAGRVVAADPVRPDAARTVAALRERGVKDIRMLTGDARATAEHVADAVGITDVRADLLAGEKVREVARITARPVMMVGDGVNDAPVLAAAEAGLAMGARGATAASESASAVILVDEVSRAVRALDIGRDTMRIALQSIWLGIALSLVLMGIAAFGFIPATAGAAIQEVVDLAAIGNALRAVRARPVEARPVEGGPVRVPDSVGGNDDDRASRAGHDRPAH